MKFETLTYSAHITDYSVSASAPSILGRLEASKSRNGIAAFLFRVAAYFHSRMASLPCVECAPQEPLTVIDTSLDNSSEPLIKVRMNRHFSRRMRWLIRRGRVQRSGEMRVATADDEARCNLTPGQFNEYCIRVHGYSRIRTYGLGLGRRALRKIAMNWAGLQGNALSLARTGLCLAPLSPD